MNTTSKATLNPNVFYPSIILICLLTLFSLFFPEFSNGIFKITQKYITKYFSWYYVLVVAIIVLAVAILGLSKYGDIKLGLDHTKPKYSNLSWFAMLFSAGMGIGLLFFGVAEPLMHYLNPPVGDARTIEAAKKALSITFFHWGFGAWSIYAIVAVILAFFSFRHNLPLTLSSAFYPIIGDKVNGKFGNIIDIFAVIATLFGVATSLGYGVIQVNAGFNHIFSIPIGINTQTILIFIITIFVAISASSGLDRGIKILSNINIILAFLFLFFIGILGNSIDLFRIFVQNIGNYLTSFLADTFNLYAYTKQNESWLGGWTILYWTWWLSWSPFVGLFIARISKGRTIREFIIGVLLVPTAFTFLWMTFFGNSAINFVNEGYEVLAQMVNKDVSLALFIFLEKFPLSSLLSIVATIMILVFFITSADSASMVIDMLCSKGRDDTPKWQKLFWAFLIGAVSAALLYRGGLEALQAMTMVSALPFSIALLGSVYGLFKALKVDIIKKESQNLSIAPSSQWFLKSWKERLKIIIGTPGVKDARIFYESIVKPVLIEVKDEFIKNKIDAKFIENKNAKEVLICIGMGCDEDFIYGIKLKTSQGPDYAQKFINNDSCYRAEVFLREGGQDYNVIGWSKDAIIGDIVEQYRKHLHFLHVRS